MNFKYTLMELEVIQQIARNQIDDLLRLQSNKGLLVERLNDIKSKSKFKESNVSLSDFYEDIAECIMQWEEVRDDPNMFLAQDFLHSYDHLEDLLNEHLAINTGDGIVDSVIELKNKVAMAKSIFLNLLENDN